MLMRYHWGLAAGHAYSHSIGSGARSEPLDADHGLRLTTDGDQQDHEASPTPQAEPPDDQSDGDDADDSRRSDSDSPSESSQDSSQLDSDSEPGESDDSESEGMDDLYGDVEDVMVSFD
ncbi:hypothetical protein H0H92_008164 [Tricholoma furcatifolium]|nr:hypothetical protein H0H92_008164 [Tricholoma furcatifolium]